MIDYKITPIAESEMKRKKHSKTVCNVFREIYQATDNEEIKLLARIGTTMAKKMDAGLRAYKEIKGVIKSFES